MDAAQASPLQAVQQQQLKFPVTTAAPREQELKKWA